MSEVKRLTKSVLTKATGNVGVMGLGLVMSVLLNRHFGKDGYGLLVLVFTVTSLAYSFCGFGAKPTLLKRLPAHISSGDKGKAWQFIVSALVAQLTGIVVLGGGVFLLAPYIAVGFYDLPVLAGLLKVGVCFFAGHALVDFVLTLYQGCEDWKRETSLSLLYPGLYLILTVLAIFWLGAGLEGVLIANALAATITVTVGFIMLPLFREYRFTGWGGFSRLREDIKDILFFGGPMLINQINLFLIMWTDKALLGRYALLEEVTFYYVAFLFINGMSILFKTLFTVFLPYVASIDRQNKEQVEQKFQIIFRWFFQIAVFLSIGAFFAIKPLVKLLYGSSYSPSITAFRLLLVVFCLRAMGNAHHIFIVNVFEKTKEFASLTVLLVIANVGLNILLIPYLGITGAIIASALAYCIHYAGVFVVFSRIRQMIPFRMVFVSAGFTFIVLLLANLVPGQGLLSVVGGTVVGVVLYSLLLFASNVITVRDIQIVKEILNLVGMPQFAPKVHGQ